MRRRTGSAAGEGSPGARSTRPDTSGNRQRTEELARAADEARDRASGLRAALAGRRGGSVSFRDQMTIWEETHRTLREMEEAARELAAESDEAEREVEREVAEHTAWVRTQVESMLDSGWSRDDLAGIGIGDEMLAQVGLGGDPRLGEPGAGVAAPARGLGPADAGAARGGRGRKRPPPDRRADT